MVMMMMMMMMMTTTFLRKTTVVKVNISTVNDHHLLLPSTLNPKSSPTHKLHCSFFFVWLIFRIPYGNPKKGTTMEPMAKP